MLDRRTHRSDSPHVALRLLLERIAHTSQLRAVALASEAGTLIAGAGDNVAEIAAVAKGATLADPDAAWELATDGDDLYTRPVTVRGRCYYLASVGAPVRRARDAEESIRRILGLRDSLS